MRYFILISLFLALAVPCAGQELVVDDIQKDIDGMQSKQFPEIYREGHWEYRWVKQECMRSMDLGDIQYAVARPPDKERCGQWLKVIGEDLTVDSHAGRILQFWCPNELGYPDSVFVPAKHQPDPLNRVREKIHLLEAEIRALKQRINTLEIERR